MNRFYLYVKDISQFTQHGFTHFVMKGTLAVEGEPPEELDLDPPYKSLPASESERHPGFKEYVEARVVINSMGLDEVTAGRLASLKGFPGEYLEAEYEFTNDPLSKAGSFTRYTKLLKGYR